MTSPRWDLISRIYHDALACEPHRRDAFLAEACGGDEAMRREIASLLAQPSGDNFLAAPVWSDSAAGAPASRRSFVGQRLGPYDLQELLGAGGMGEVYRARDTKLDREVAIKILPPVFTNHSDRLARFNREARVLAALNHPHIAAIYGFEQAGDLHGLVLELVDGETLAERLARGPLPLAEALPIARAIAEALDIAHEKGIIHRDLKPANVKIRTDGAVKVLDFGLAKALNDPSPSPSITTGLSVDGLVLGTPAYMSPEQARGKPVDKRADIWAFGCLMYEILTGRPAFPGETATDTLAAVLSRDPNLAALPPGTPASIVRLLRRCLEKDPRHRLRDIGDARLELDSDVEGAVAGPASRMSWWRSRRTAWTLAALALTATSWLIVDRMRAPASSSIVEVNLERLTYDAGITTMPALSPEGELLAYASNRSGRGDLDIWVSRTAGGSPLRLTDDPADDHSPDFSPDGKQIVFRSDRAGGGVYLVPAFGGTARLLIEGGKRPRFSPDGSSIAYWTGPSRGLAPRPGSQVLVAPLDGGRPTRLALDLPTAQDPVWSPDGRSLLVLGRGADHSEDERFDWWWVPVDGRPAVKTGLYATTILGKTLPIQHEGSPAVWHESGVLLTALGDLWSIPLSAADGRLAGPPERLTAITGRVAGSTRSRDGAIVFASTQSQRAIERVQIAEPGRAAAPVRLYVDNRRVALRPSVSADGSLIVFEQFFDTYREIWSLALPSGKQELVLQAEDSVFAGATVSPDGKQIAYSVGLNSAVLPRSFVVDVSRGVPRQVCEGCWASGFLSDNRRLLAVWDDWKVIGTIDVRSGARTVLLRIIEGRLERPHASPDDRWLAFRYRIGVEGGSFVVRLHSDRPVARESWQEVERTPTGRPSGWAPDSRTLYTWLDTDGFRCLWAHRIDRDGRLVGAPAAVRHFHQQIDAGPSTSLGNPITADGLLYEGVYQNSDLWRLTPAARSAR